MIYENNIKKERRSSRGDPDQTGWLHPNIPRAADFQTHQTLPRVPAAGEHQHEQHCGPSYSRRRWRRCGPRRRSSSSGSTASPCSWSSSAPQSTTQRGAQSQPSPAASWQLTADSIRVQADGESPQPVHLHPQLHVVGGRHHVYRGYGEYRNEFYLPCAEVWI